MSDPAISIVVPVYNVKNYLEECLNSLASQTLKNIEIICIDDGSSDGSSELLDLIAKHDERIRVIHKENYGVASARNDGMGAATGRYLMFVDSDDYISHTACEILMNTAEESSADIVVFGGKTFPTSPWADWAFAARDITYINDGVNALLNEQGANPLMCNKLYRREFLREQHASFDTNLSLGEDNAFQFKLFPAAQSIAFIKDMLYFYRIREDSAVSTSFENYDERLEKHLDVVKAVWEHWEARGFLPAYLVNLFAWAVTFLYNEAEHASFNARSVVCQGFVAYTLEKLGDTNPFSLIIDDRILRMYSFLLDAASFNGDDPLITVLIEESYGIPLSRDGIESILVQSVQQLDIVLLPRACSSTKEQALIDELIQKDGRIRCLPVDDARALTDEVRGAFLIISTSHERYDATAFRTMLENAGVLHPLSLSAQVASPESASDLVVIKDAVGLIKIEDPFSFYQPEPAQVITALSGLPATCYQSHIGSALTFFACNKLVSRNLFSSAVHGAAEGTDLLLLIELCAQMASAIRAVGKPCFAFEGIPLDEDQYDQIAQRVNENIGLISESLRAAETPQSDIEAIMIDLMDAQKLYLHTVSELIVDSDTNRVSLADLACSAGMNAMAQNDKAREDLTCLGQTIERIENSTSLRIGRMAVSVPRKIVDSLQKLRRG